jgi:DNA-binding response OmpR family regulator
MSQRILILDDDPDLLQVLSILLVDSGYEVLALASGEKVFESIKSFHPNLVLMDVMLAGMDGRAICRSIKERPNTLALPVILISASGGLAQSMLQRGAPNDYLAKPFDLNFLLEKIKNQLIVLN